MVISEEKRPLVTLCRKCRPPSSVFISLSKSRAFPLRLGPLPAFGPAVIEEGSEATACICNHKCIRGELKTDFLERAAPGLFFTYLETDSGGRRVEGVCFEHVHLITEGRVRADRGEKKA